MPASDPSNLRLHVALLSGLTASIEAQGHWSVKTLRQHAQEKLDIGFCKLINGKGEILTRGSLDDCGLADDETLHAMVRRPRIVSNRRAHAFACIRADGTVISWGSNGAGDSGSVHAQLVDVVDLAGTAGAFAALLENQEVVTWGDSTLGGDASSVSLRGVRQIQATAMAFGALKEDGTVVTWGSSHLGGNCSRVQGHLKDVSSLSASAGAFAALKVNGQVITWGQEDFGGDSSKVESQLKNVQHIQPASFAFAAVLEDGSVVTWGEAMSGGDSTSVQEELQNVKTLKSTAAAFAAIRSDGTLVSWGAADQGGDSQAVQAQLCQVSEVEATGKAFAAILATGRVVTWGDPAAGGDSSSVQHQLYDVQQIVGSAAAFAALRGDGVVVAWGDVTLGGDVADAEERLQGVQQIAASAGAFAVQSGAVIQRPCLCMIATSFNCTVMERRKRLRRGAGYGRDWLTEVSRNETMSPRFSSPRACLALPSSHPSLCCLAMAHIAISFPQRSLGPTKWVLFRFQPPADLGTFDGDLVTSYSIFYACGPNCVKLLEDSESSEVKVIRGARPTSTMISGLRPGSDIAVQVFGTNNFGDGPVSNVALFRSNPSEPEAPNAPRSNLAERTSWSTFVSVLPCYDGGCPVTQFGFEIQEVSDGSIMQTPVWGTNPPDEKGYYFYSINTLRPGRIYKFRAFAVNEIGSSEWSEWSDELETHPFAPEAPTTPPRLMEPDAYNFTATWDDIPGNGSPVKEWVIQWSVDPQFSSKNSIREAKVAERTYRCNRCLPGLVMHVRVAGINSEGQSHFGPSAVRDLGPILARMLELGCALIMF
ncbi:unnamed protein product [Cladocopium goreaui]|uniref:Fibronectin type-III domain-containing protein 3A n=1 Tax=Cladocopium goreaui TaxID=2562237 RepID=A0A9P1FUE7_9DINO|nr:unnamed protein product [Cladocopium goreaui]